MKFIELLVVILIVGVLVAITITDLSHVINACTPMVRPVGWTSVEYHRYLVSACVGAN